MFYQRIILRTPTMTLRELKLIFREPKVRVRPSNSGRGFFLSPRTHPDKQKVIFEYFGISKFRMLSYVASFHQFVVGTHVAPRPRPLRGAKSCLAEPMACSSSWTRRDTGPGSSHSAGVSLPVPLPLWQSGMPPEAELTACGEDLVDARARVSPSQRKARRLSLIPI